MYQAPPTKTKSLLGTSDLTLVANIKTGFAPALDARTYQSRLRILLGALSAGRTSSQEAQPTPLIEDAIDRIRAIHSFRLAIVGEPFKPQLLLAVTFDGGWEPYMRRIWRDLGPLLDVIFCNCEDYLISRNHSYAQYVAWVRSAQVTTEFLYAASPLTVDDLHYFRDREQGRLVPLASKLPALAPPAGGTVLEQALPALTTLYRLADMYLPQGQPKPHDDADVLLEAARMFLASAEQALQVAAAHSLGKTPTEQAALRWFAQPTQAEKHAKALAKAPLAGAAAAPAPAALQHDKVQGGIVEQYPGMTHGCVLLVQLKDAAAAQALLEHLEPVVTRASAQLPGGKLKLPCVNVAFTLEGLRVAGVPAATLEQMPIEFREGMAARASILGDVERNHPTRWALPEHNWPIGPKPWRRVELSSVHVIVQFATSQLPSKSFDDFFADPLPAKPHPLRSEVAAFDKKLRDKGVRILSVQPTQRYIASAKAPAFGHFKYVDGVSQPSAGGGEPPYKTYNNHVPLGDVLLGYENSLEDAPCKGRLWDDSTFMVFRKLEQDVQAFKDLLARSSLPAFKAKELLMGRTSRGRNLVAPAQPNDFDYKDDPLGAKCPFQSHVRRANPRTPGTPRIIRRGMSYGPPFKAQPQEERGLMFSAYNASITEQFEVIQGWLSGGSANGARAYSALRDPFLGMCAAGDPQRFAFNGGSFAVDPQQPLVTLQWGLYAFVPSIEALKELADRARDAVARTAPKCPHHSKQTGDERKRKLMALVMKGAGAIKLLQGAERLNGVDAAKTQWKIALEDFSARVSGTSQAIWAAIRELHGGVLKTPYGVLVCSAELAQEVYANTLGRYTVAGYNERLGQSIGKIYLGQDDGVDYRRESVLVNEAIFDVLEGDSFYEARRSMRAAVQQCLTGCQGDGITVEVKDLVDHALGDLCVRWFGIPDGIRIEAGGWSLGSEAPATCPGHFQSPSRETFQPNPGPEASRTGKEHGQALQTAVRLLLSDKTTAQVIRSSRLGKKIAAAAGSDPDLLGRNLIGAMMGMLPTVDGNLRSALYEWMKDRSLWDHQLAYLAAAGTEYQNATAVLLPPLRRAMQLRPVPELVWRTAVTAHQLKSATVNAGDTVVVSIVSAAQENLLNDSKDLSPIFGGMRSKSPAGPGEALHACPGYKMAMGTLLGLIAGLLESGTFRPTLSPTTLKVGRP